MEYSSFSNLELELHNVGISMVEWFQWDHIRGFFVAKPWRGVLRGHAFRLGAQLCLGDGCGWGFCLHCLLKEQLAELMTWNAWLWSGSGVGSCHTANAKYMLLYANILAYIPGAGFPLALPYPLPFDFDLGRCCNGCQWGGGAVGIWCFETAVSMLKIIPNGYNSHGQVDIDWTGHD